MEPLGPVQMGLPLLSALPEHWSIFIIDLKDCFFSIPLHPEDTPKFAFTVPSSNQEEPCQRFEWTVLPQGMANSPTMCQLYVAAKLASTRQQFPQVKIIHYMDDILLAHRDTDLLKTVLSHLVLSLREANLEIAPEKIQMTDITTFLGAKVAPTHVSPQKVSLRLDNIHTLNDLQKLMGDINWIRPYLKIPNVKLTPLFDLLKGDSNINSPRSFTPEARRALCQVEQALSGAALKRIDPDEPFEACVLPTELQPTAVLWQRGPLLWVHPGVSPKKVLEHYPTAVADLALECIKRAVQHFGQQPKNLRVPYSSQQLEILTGCIDQWAILRCTFLGPINNQFPKAPLLQFVTRHPVIFPKVTSPRPLAGAPTVYTDGSSSGTGAYCVEGDTPKTVLFQPQKPQWVELQVIIAVLESLSEPLNVVSDSAYVVNSVQILETVGIVKHSSTVRTFFAKLQEVIWTRQHPFYITHIRAHTGLPGPMAQGNHSADVATRQLHIFPTLVPYQQAREFHAKFHINAGTLAKRFSIPRAAARDIVRACNNCAEQRAVPSVGVNPRGLTPGDTWQMDVTHHSEYGKIKYLHVSVDTCSQVLFASAEPGERVSHVIAHCLAAWAAWGKPKTLKTDNGPAYTSKSFQKFCDNMDVQLKHGIPYNPQGQGIIERAHRSLKDLLKKQKEGIGHGLSPKARLSVALLTYNFLNENSQGMTPALQHTTPSPPHRGLVRWKDVLSGQWKGPDPVLSWARGSVCVFPQEPGRQPVWVPERLVRTVTSPEEAKEQLSETPTNIQPEPLDQASDPADDGDDRQDDNSRTDHPAVAQKEDR